MLYARLKWQRDDQTWLVWNSFASKANMVSLKDVWWWWLKSQPCRLTSRLWQTYQGIPAISRIYWTWQMERHFRQNWRVLFLLVLKVLLENAAAGNIWWALIKRGALTWSIIAFGGRAAEHTEGSLIISTPRVWCSILRGCIHFNSASLMSLQLSSSFTPIPSSLFSLPFSYSSHFASIHNNIPMWSTHTWEASAIYTEKRAL